MVCSQAHSEGHSSIRGSTSSDKFPSCGNGHRPGQTERQRAQRSREECSHHALELAQHADVEEAERLASEVGPAVRLQQALEVLQCWEQGLSIKQQHRLQQLYSDL